MKVRGAVGMPGEPLLFLCAVRVAGVSRAGSMRKSETLLRMVCEVCFLKIFAKVM